MAARPDNGFSIREYTSKMRSIDVFKCWPFTSNINRELTREELQSWLPPMTLRCPRSEPLNHHNKPEEPSRTRVEASRTVDVDSNEEESSKSDHDSLAAAPPDASADVSASAAADDEGGEAMVCPVCREFNAATLTAVNAHIDGCLAQTMREERRHMRMMNLKSSKSRPPKKRSIAEIFKKVQEVEEEEEEHKVLKLWPLREVEEEEENNDADVDDEVSVTVRKFQWLSNRLEALRSSRGDRESARLNAAEEVEEEEKMEMVCPVCRDFNAATVTAVNAHIDSCLAQAVRDERRQIKRSFPKLKPKAPKKRSIAEILTAAPPIEEARKSKSKGKVVEAEEDEDEEEDEDGDCSTATAVVSVIKSKGSTNKNSKGKKVNKANRKKKLEKHGDSVVVSVNSEKKKKTIVSKKNKKIKKNNVYNNDLTKKKEDAYKRMVQTTVRSSRKLRGSTDNKSIALHDIDPSVHRKKLCLNGLSVRKKQEVKNCDSVGKQQKAVSSVGGIPKNHSKHVSGKTSSDCNSFQDGTEDSDYSDYNDQMPTSDRQVKFSGKADIHCEKERDSVDETMFNISSDAPATSSVKLQSSGSDEENASWGANRNYDHIAINVDKEKSVCPIVESKQFVNTMEQVTVQSFLKPCTNQENSKLSEEKSELLTKMAINDNNRLLHFDGGNTTTLLFSPYADMSRPLAAVKEDKTSGINTQVCESGSFSSSAKFIDHSEDPPTYQFGAVNKNGDTKTTLEHSSSYSVSYYKANENPEASLQTYGDTDNSGHALGDRQLPHVFPGSMIDNTFPFTSWSKGRDINSSSNPNFFGLPLNSHGELINFSSSVKVGLDQPETSSTSRSSLSALPIDNILHQSMQENLSINERHVVQKTFPKDGLNPFTQYSSGLAFTRLPCSEREDIHRPKSDFSSHYVQPLNPELLKQNSFRMQNHSGNGMVSLKEGSDHISPSSSQPTVRLMGKDVPIGRSSQEMQQFATDVWTDEESRRHYSQYALENSFLGRCPKQDWVSGSSSQVSTDNVLHSAKFQSNQGLMDGADSGFSQPFIDLQSNHASRNGSLGISRNSSSYFNPITQDSTSYAVCNRAHEDFPERCIPGAKPPGMNCRSPVLPTPCNFDQPTCSSNRELNDRNKNPLATKSAFGFPFLQPSVDEQAKTSWFQRPYGHLPSWLSSSPGEMLPGTFSQQFSGIRSQGFPQNQWGNNFVTPSVNHSAEVLYPSNPLTSRGPMKTSPPCPASFSHPLRPSVKSSTLNSGCRNINKVPDSVRLDDIITEDHHPCINTRKRPAVYLDDSRKHVKLSSNMDVKESSGDITRLPGENSSVELQRSTTAVELDSQVDSARSRCGQNLNPTSYPAFDSFKMDGGTVTSGPLRLGPKRAKLILRSS
ncbi:uncharacterized protein LOC130733204 [Lotus japonicus]|uniref:uncharacterized protein LOC130733204 n=1 Tax=Lotus japonicus TaxID=34305 RepID=UPI00258CA536|nr:uncharacterized protein LOC130733204 [Lotus japonicus]